MSPPPTTDIPAQHDTAVAVDPVFPTTPAMDVDRSDDDYFIDLIRVEERRNAFLTSVVIPLGASLVYETDFNRLLERLLISAMSLSSADGGAVYLRRDDTHLRVAILRREGKGVALAGTASVAPDFGPIELPAGSTDDTSPAVRATVSGETVVVFDRQPSRSTMNDVEAFDDRAGYALDTMLATPLRDNAGRIIGVIELCNPRSGEGEPIGFEAAVVRTVEALALLAAAAVSSYVRQEKLKDQVRQLKVEVDRAKKSQQVDAITKSDYFQQLQSRAREIRASARGVDDPASNR